jgi:hypothetical protein
MNNMEFHDKFDVDVNALHLLEMLGPFNTLNMFGSEKWPKVKLQ